MSLGENTLEAIVAGVIEAGPLYIVIIMLIVVLYLKDSSEE